MPTAPMRDRARSLLRRLLAGAVLLAFPVLAPAAHADPQDTSSFITLQFDNDMFGGSDRYFTNGMRAAYLSPEGAAPSLIRDAGAAVPLFHASQDMRFSFSIGQNIFTPSDITDPDPPEDDRPYAGWLYAGFGLVSEDGTWLDKLELDVGIVGPYSFAEQTQTEWHRIFGLRQPRGWDTQLETEPGIVLYYERSKRKLYEFKLDDVIPIKDLGVDFTPHFGGAIGNVYTYGAAGMTVRFGDDLPTDFGPPKIRPSLPGADFFEPDDAIGWYIFAGAEMRLVLRDIFLDGNTFRDSRSVTKIPAVVDLQGGIAVTFWRARLTYTQVFRSPEFYGQDNLQSFGSVALTMRF